MISLAGRGAACRTFQRLCVMRMSASASADARAHDDLIHLCSRLSGEGRACAGLRAPHPDPAPGCPRERRTPISLISIGIVQPAGISWELLRWSRWYTRTSNRSVSTAFVSAAFSGPGLPLHRPRPVERPGDERLPRRPPAGSRSASAARSASQAKRPTVCAAHLRQGSSPASHSPA